jgi:hypothetical protein
MSQATSEFDRHLPLRIERAEYSEPTLLLGGADWSLSATCSWRWVDRDGRVIGPSTRGVEDAVWELAGDEIVRAEWFGPASVGTDPLLHLKSGAIVQIVSDATFDTWVVHLPSLVLVGPLREDS